MKAVIYYLTEQEGLEPVYHPIYLKGAVVYIRTETVEVKNLSNALMCASPKPGEVVLGVQPYPEAK